MCDDGVKRRLTQIWYSKTQDSLNPFVRKRLTKPKRRLTLQELKDNPEHLALICSATDGIIYSLNVLSSSINSWIKTADKVDEIGIYRDDKSAAEYVKIINKAVVKTITKINRSYAGFVPQRVEAT